VRLTPNINGTDPKTLLEQRQAVFEALDAAGKAVVDNWPHARDYQLASDIFRAHKEDSDEWLAALEAINQLQEKLAEEIGELYSLISR